MPDDFRLLLAQIEPIKAKMLLLAAAEQTQADRFAVHGRNRRDPDVDVLLVRLQINAAILRKTPLSDVHVRHYFQAGDDGRLEQAKLRRHSHFVQDSVDAITNAKIVFQWL